MFSCALAESSLDAAGKKQLSHLEQRYFGHAFESDSDEDRAARIEKLLFGDLNEGSVQDRINKLVAISPPEESKAPEPEKPVPDKAAKTSSRSARGVVPVEPPRSSNKAASSSLGDEDSLQLKDYPHIAELEKSILSKTFPGTPLAERLCRLETKAFGSPSQLADYSQRTDALDDYAEKTLHIKRANPDEMADQGQSPTLSSQPEYPHITALETAILGQSFPGQPLSARISRMEASAFGSSSADSDLSKRTDALERYAEKTLHKKPLVAQDNSGSAGAGGQSSGSTKSKQVLAMVGNTLLGVSGLGGLGMMGGAMGMGAMGMGPKGGPVRFGGMRLGAKAQGAAPEEPEPDDDPAAMTVMPPPASAQILTKVAWCEYHVYGHTFPKMHLTDRLTQLSRELQFNTNKSGLDLMDDVGSMLKTVQARQKPATPIGTTSQSAVQ